MSGEPETKTLTGTVDCKFLTACTLQCNCSQGGQKGTCLSLLQQSGPSPTASSCPLDSLQYFFAGLRREEDGGAESAGEGGRKVSRS